MACAHTSCSATGLSAVNELPVIGDEGDLDMDLSWLLDVSLTEVEDASEESTQTQAQTQQTRAAEAGAITQAQTRTQDGDEADTAASDAAGLPGAALASTVHAMDRTLQAAFAGVVESYGGRGMLLQPPSIVTMTTTFKTSLEEVQLDYSGSYGEHVRVKESKKPFKNCIIFSVASPLSSARVAVKVFRNGTLHITGPKSFTEANVVAGRMLGVLAQDAGVPAGAVTTSQVATNMINVSMRIPRTLDMDLLFEVLRRQPGPEHVAYDRVRHSAINIKFKSLFASAGSAAVAAAGAGDRPKSKNKNANKKGVTILLYKSGAVNVSGSRLDDVRERFHELLRLLELPACQPALLPLPSAAEAAPQEPKKRGRKRKADHRQEDEELETLLRMKKQLQRTGGAAA